MLIDNVKAATTLRERQVCREVAGDVGANAVQNIVRERRERDHERLVYEYVNHGPSRGGLWEEISEELYTTSHTP